MALKAFSGIEFEEDRSNAVEPLSWIISNDNGVYFCSWPHKNVTSKAKMVAIPSSKWTKHKCIILTGASK